MPISGVDRVYLARHGRTALNVDGRLRGLSDPPLDDVGQVEAKRLGELLCMLDPTLAGITQGTACYNQISRGEGRWRVDFYDRKPR